MSRGLLQAVASFFGNLLFRTAVDAVVFPADGKAERYRRRLVRRGIFASHIGAGTDVAAGTAVEGVADGVEDGRLTGPGRAVDEE